MGLSFQRKIFDKLQWTYYYHFLFCFRRSLNTWGHFKVLDVSACDYWGVGRGQYVQNVPQPNGLGLAPRLLTYLLCGLSQVGQSPEASISSSIKQGFQPLWKHRRICWRLGNDVCKGSVRTSSFPTLIPNPHASQFPWRNECTNPPPPLNEKVSQWKRNMKGKRVTTCICLSSLHFLPKALNKNFSSVKKKGGDSLHTHLRELKGDNECKVLSRQHRTVRV